MDKNNNNHKKSLRITLVPDLYHWISKSDWPPDLPVSMTMTAHLLNKFTWKVVQHAVWGACCEYWATLLHHTENIVQNMMYFNLICTWPAQKLHTIPDNEHYHCDTLSETSPLGYSLWSSCSETYCDSCSWSCLAHLMFSSRWRPTSLRQSDSSITQIETFWTHGILLNSNISNIHGFMARVF